MQTPVQIAFRDVASSPAVEAAVREKVAELEKVFSRIVGCDVVVERPHHRHQQGNLFNVRVRLSVPGDLIVVDEDHHDKSGHADVYVAVRDAFQAARRQLSEYAGRMRQHQKAR